MQRFKNFGYYLALCYLLTGALYAQAQNKTSLLGIDFANLGLDKLANLKSNFVQGLYCPIREEIACWE